MFFQGSKRTPWAFFSIVTTLLRLQLGHHLKRKLIWLFSASWLKFLQIYFLLWQVLPTGLVRCWRKIKWTEMLGSYPGTADSLFPALEWATEPRHSNGSVFSAVFHRRDSFISLHEGTSCQAPFYPPPFATEERKQIVLYWFRTQPSSFESQGSVWVIMVELVVHLGSTW